MLYLVHQRKTSLRHTKWLAKVLESWRTSRLSAALNDSANAWSALVPTDPIDCLTPRFLHVSWNAFEV